MKSTGLKLSLIKYSFALLIPFLLLSVSCKKDKVEEEEVETYPSYVHLNFHNHPASEHYINLIETRIKRVHGSYVDENWSENILQLGHHVKPNDSTSLYITMDRDFLCEMRFGVISNTGQVILIYEQEGWFTPVDPYFSRGKVDEIDFTVTARTASDGIIYIQDWQ